MRIEVDPSHINQQEDALTVVKGCLATVLHFGDRLGDTERDELLRVALVKTDELVTMFENEIAPLRI
ncbi:MAG TPA: hypothetical protein VG408_08925 [Actinomycetota bacterium]|nr:hypothetical protein [Actinomycetota bacterium]